MYDALDSFPPLWFHWVFTAVWTFSSCWELGLLFVVVPGLLIAVASPVVEHRLSGCDTRALVNLSMWSLPGSGIEPMSLALASGLPSHRTTREVLQHVDSIYFSFAT